MHDEFVFLLCVDDRDACTVVFQHTGIPYLPPAFGIEGCLVEHELKELLVFLLHFAVAQGPRFVFDLLITGKRYPGPGLNFNPITCFKVSCGPRTAFLPSHGFFKSRFIRLVAPLTGNEPRQVGRKAVGVIEFKNHFTGDELISGMLPADLLQPAKPVFEGA